VVLTLFCIFTRPCIEAAEAVEEEKEEEEEMDLGGRVDMFGGEEVGGGDYQAKQSKHQNVGLKVVSPHKSAMPEVERGTAPQAGDDAASAHITRTAQ
jgi:hypothetical protein